jgi:ubiquitin fusion degradation protein 1
VSPSCWCCRGSNLTPSGPRIITPDSFNDDRKVPSALHLPQGKFFFGYTYVPFNPDKVVKKPVDILPTGPFGGQGTSLRSQVKSEPQAQTQGESSATGAAAASASAAVAAAAPPQAEDPWAKFGSGTGNTLSGRGSKSTKVKEEKVEKSAAEQRQEVIDATMLDDDDFWGDEVMDDDDDDNDVIEIDSD